MAVYSRDAGQIVDGSVASGSAVVQGASTFQKQQADVFATAGTWRVWWQDSPDGGTTWIQKSDIVTLVAGDESTNSGSVSTGFFCRSARLRYVLDVGPGDLDAWLIQDDDTPNGVR